MLSKENINRKRKKRFLLLIAICIVAGICIYYCNKKQDKTGDVPQFSHTFEVVRTIKSDPENFTQGLVIHEDSFYLGTGGSKGALKIAGDHSYLMKIDIASGKVEWKQALPPEYFGEGITILHDKIYQLTWKNNTAFSYLLAEPDTEKPAAIYSYEGQGWGLTHNGSTLIMSNGSANLLFINPHDFTVIKTLTVKDGEQPVPLLNELEYVEGEIYANIYKKNYLVRICPQTGNVLGYIDFSGLHKPAKKYKGQDVLNGIAYDQKRKELYVTGKLWKKIFEVKLVQTEMKQ